jgi:membrane-anchored protein YejM (alkaline phosphatase superfamily)
MGRIEFAIGTLGCMMALLFAMALVVFWLVGFVDLSESTARGAEVFAWVQSIKIGSFPLGAVLFAGYIVYEGGINGWRWADKTALMINGNDIFIHPSYRNANMSLEDVISVTKTYKTSTWSKAISPSLAIRWHDVRRARDRSVTIRNLNLGTPDAHRVIELLKNQQKWFEAF